MKPQFYGVIERASNVSNKLGDYTEEMFRTDFPQFFDAMGTCWVPDGILADFIAQANSSITPDKWLETWRYGAGLFVAHQATMFLRSYRSYSQTPEEAASSGQVLGTVKSASLGDASASYDDGSSTMATQGWGDLNATSYGQLLATKARLIGMGGSYVL